jgi:hypothetical protein
MSTTTLPRQRTAETVDTEADLVTCDYGQHEVPAALTVDCGDCNTTHCGSDRCDTDHQIHHDGGVL